MPSSRPTITLYTDGAASGNPGPGGYGVVLKCGALKREISGGFRCTTNNRMELFAVITGLEAIRWDRADVEVFSDSTYVVKALTEGWLDKWKRTGFKKVKNPDLWQRFVLVYSRHNVHFNWVKGHAGNPLNERCDFLATTSYRQPDLPEDEGYMTSGAEGSLALQSAESSKSD